MFRVNGVVAALESCSLNKINLCTYTKSIGDVY